MITVFCIVFLLLGSAGAQDSGLPNFGGADLALLQTQMKILLPNYDSCRYVGGGTVGAAPYFLWSVGGGNLRIAEVFKTNGYLAFGINRNNDTAIPMFPSDLQIGIINGGTPTVRDYNSNGRAVNQDAQQDVTNANFVQNGTIAIMSYTRPITGTGADDFTIPNSVWTYIWSSHTSYSIVQHGNGRWYFHQNLYEVPTCPSGCSGQGTCTKGCCVCNVGFTGFDCSVVDTPATSAGPSGLPSTINPTDFAFSNKLTDAFTLFWDLDAENQIISLAVEVSATGWVAFGISENGLMTESDIMFGWVDGAGVVNVQDRYISGRSGGCPGVCLDTGRGGTDDIIDFNGNENGGKTQILWRRSFATGDSSNDYDFKEGSLNVIFGYHPDSDGPGVTQHTSTSKGSATIDFFSGAVSVASNKQKNRQAHGFLMFFAWSFLVPIASFIGRYLKKFAWWFNVHRLINGFSMWMVLAAFIIAVDFTVVHFDTFHKAFGLAIVILGMAQPFLGTFADKWFSLERQGTPVFPDKVHWVIGWISIIAGFINVGIGIDEYYGEDKIAGLLIAYIVYIALFTLFLVGYFIYDLIFGKRDH